MFTRLIFWAVSSVVRALASHYAAFAIYFTKRKFYKGDTAELIVKTDGQK